MKAKVHKEMYVYYKSENAQVHELTTMWAAESKLQCDTICKHCKINPVPTTVNPKPNLQLEGSTTIKLGTFLNYYKTQDKQTNLLVVKQRFP